MVYGETLFFARNAEHVDFGIWDYLILFDFFHCNYLYLYLPEYTGVSFFSISALGFWNLSRINKPRLLPFLSLFGVLTFLQ